MRRLILALVAANIAFFAWQMFGRTEPAGGAAPIGEGSAPRLVMLAEVPTAQRPAPRAPLVPDELPAGLEAAQSQEPTPSPAPTDAPALLPATCFHLAGFPSAASATRTKGGLEKAGATVGAATAERFARTRYWVLLPPSRTQAQAMAMGERLRQAGLTDYYLIPDGPNRNAISLGVFSTQDGAKRRVAEVTRLKLKVRVEKVDYPGRRFALDVRWPAALPADWAGRVPPGVEITNAPCNSAP